MPVTYVHIEWPDRTIDHVYSPSSVIRKYFKSEEYLSIEMFSATCTKALNEASERVRQKFGITCTAAKAESQRINALCETYDNSKKVKIVSIN